MAFSMYLLLLNMFYFYVINYTSIAFDCIDLKDIGVADFAFYG